MPVTVGSPIPDFEAAATQSGRDASPQSLRGRRIVYVVHGVPTADAAKAVSKAVRSRFPSARDVALVSIVDLRSMGGLWRRVAEAQLKSTYAKLAAKVESLGLGEAPEDHVMIVPDWDGSLATLLANAPTGEEATAVVVDKEGVVRAVATGKDPSEAVMQALS